jgi:hypothetical protein
MKICSSQLMCCDEDESTTNHISRTDGSILMCDTRKSMPIRLERIPDATVPIGTDLYLRQASCENGKRNFRNNSMMMPYRDQYLLDLDTGIFESHLHDLISKTPIR